MRKCVCLMLTLLLAASCCTAMGESEAKLSLPFEETQKITYWQRFDTGYANEIASYDLVPFVIWMEERLNVDFEFIAPSAAVAADQYALMLASGDYPDVMPVGFYSGGAEKMLADGVIIELTDLMNEGYMPNLAKVLEAIPSLKPAIGYSGKYLTIPNVYGPGATRSSAGPALRADILEKMGKEAPTTLDEWYDVLTAMKEYGVKIPFSCTGIGAFASTSFGISAYDVGYGFYQVDGQVKYGPLQDEFKTWLEMMSKWYAEGLLDPDFLSQDNNTMLSKLAEGLVGSALGAAGGTFFVSYSAVVDGDIDTDFMYVGVQEPVLEKGSVAKVGPKPELYREKSSMAISSQCENPEAVALAMDFLYSEEMAIVNYFGLEGIHYTKTEDGLYQNWYIDESGKVAYYEDTNRWAPYLNYDGFMPFISQIPDLANGRYIPKNELVAAPEGDPTSVTWVKSNYRATTWQDMTKVWSQEYPYTIVGTRKTVDELSEYNELITPINTIVEETVAQIIVGIKPIEEYDAVVAQLYSMGVERAIAIEQAALDRYFA